MPQDKYLKQKIYANHFLMVLLSSVLHTLHDVLFLDCINMYTAHCICIISYTKHEKETKKHSVS